MSEQKLDYLIIGPATPFRGGIADTQHELALHLHQMGKKVLLMTFTKLYPKILFPGKTQKKEQKQTLPFEVVASLHAYNPFLWAKVVRQIDQLNPKNLIFRYYTPFLAPVYGWIAKNSHSKIKKIALVDNWIPHERRFWDTALNRYFGKPMDAFTTLSSGVAFQIKKLYRVPIWEGFHPINTHLLPPLSKSEARKKLGWNTDSSIVLFFGLIRKYKGLELLIRAFAEKELNTQNVLLKVVGECYENPKKYTNLVAQLGLENAIEFDFEFKSEKEIQHLFSAADLVAQTYHTATQSGVTPLAYFYKTPLLVSDIEGLNTPVKKDGTGICVPKNPKSIAQGISSLLEKKTSQKALENLDKSLPKYRWSQWVKEWGNFINTL